MMSWMGCVALGWPFNLSEPMELAWKTVYMLLHGGNKDPSGYRTSRASFYSKNRYRRLLIGF